MSKKNGDKARFNKEQKKKLLRRKRNLMLRQSLTNNAVGMTEAVLPSPGSAPLLIASPDGIDSEAASY
ncbi:MAG: hypothetical protein JNM09_10700 [Blastocatellia bacterium]|nr:hypothetical protein [Blastocatellia bacterium]